jgi:hypothetical protein
MAIAAMALQIYMQEQARNQGMMSAAQMETQKNIDAAGEPGMAGGEGVATSILSGEAMTGGASPNLLAAGPGGTPLPPEGGSKLAEGASAGVGAAATIEAAKASGAEAAAAGGGGGGFMGSTAFQYLAPLAIGILASQDPHTARGIQTGLGAFGMFQGLSDRGNVASALGEYSEGVDKMVGRERLDRGINEAVVSSGAEKPSALDPGGPFVMGGPAPTTYGGTSMEEMEQFAASTQPLSALGAASPRNAGYLLAESARRAPTPGPAVAERTMAQGMELMEMRYPNHDLSGRMTEKGWTVDAKTPVPQEAAEADRAQFTTEGLASARETMGNLPAGVTETISVLGPAGAERKITGKGEVLGGGGGGSGVAGATGFGTVNPAAGQFVFDRATGKMVEITPEIWEQIQRAMAMEEAGGIAGTVIRNPDGTTTIRR